jgi:hypothetical protein
MIDELQSNSTIEQVVQRHIFLTNEAENIAEEIVYLVGRQKELLDESNRNLGRLQPIVRTAWPPRKKVANTSQAMAVAS